MEDREIIDLYFARDEQAIVETERRYGKLCHKLARRIIGNEQDAEECVNDVYLGVWQAIPPERPRSLAAFVARVTHNLSVARLRYRMAAKRNPDVLVSLSELEEIIPDPAAFEELEDRDVGQWISEFLYTEEEDVRHIFVRKYWYFDSITEIAETFGYSESKVKSILFRTRNKLKLYLTEKGVAL